MRELLTFAPDQWNRKTNEGEPQGWSRMIPAFGACRYRPDGDPAREYTHEDED